MKKAITFRLQGELLVAARDCAVREHRTLTNFVEVSLRDRIGLAAAEVAKPRPSKAKNAERTPYGD